VEALRAHDRVDRIDIVDRTGPVPRGSESSHPRRPPRVAAAREVGIPIEDPVWVTDGRATLDIVDDRSRLTAFGRRRLTAEGVTVGIEASDADEEPILTDAQRDLVLAAVAAGYYDTPRECTLTDLAKARGLAKSTCSETLHRAEGRVLRRFVAGEFDDEDSETSVGKGIGDESEREPDRDGHHRTVTALGT